MTCLSQLRLSYTHSSKEKKERREKKGAYQRKSKIEKQPPPLPKTKVIRA